MNIFSELRSPDLFTILNAALGFAAVMAAGYGEFGISVLLVLAAAVADGLDGFLARRLGAGVLGPQLDSMADLVSFGVAPAVIAATVIESLWPYSTRSSWIFGAVLCGLFLVCGILRLARFNISPKSDLHFEGLPIPAAGIILSASVLLERPSLTLILMLSASALMVCSLPYPKIRDMKLAIPLAAVFLAAAFLILSGRFQSIAALMFYAATALYLFSPVVISWLRKER